MGKKITLDFLRGYQLGTRRESDPVAYQYDEGHTLEVKVPTSVTTAEIQYWIRGMDKAEAYTPGEITAEEDGTYTITGNVPNSFFEHSGDLRVYVVVTDDSASTVTYEGYIHIVDRQMPEDYVDDDPDNEAVRVLAAAREAAAEAQASAEDAAGSAQAAQDILDSIPEDYSALSDEVTDLKADLSELYQDDVFSSDSEGYKYVAYDIRKGETYIFTNNTPSAVSLRATPSNTGAGGELISSALASGASITYVATNDRPYIRIYFNVTGTVSVSHDGALVAVLYETSPYHKLRYKYDAKALGGNTDDDVALQNYINDEKYVVIPSGEYFLHKPLIINHVGTVLEGEGQGWSAILRPYDNTVPALINASPEFPERHSLMMGLRNLCFRTVNYDGSFNPNPAIISTDYIIDSKIENCWFNGGDTNSALVSKAMHLRAIHSMILGCWFEMFDTAAEIINQDGPSHGVVFNNCTFWHNKNSILMNGHGAIKDCVFDTCKGGFVLKSDDESRIVFSDNIITLIAPSDLDTTIYTDPSGVVFEMDDDEANVSIQNVSIYDYKDTTGSYYEYLIDAPNGKVSAKDIDVGQCEHLIIQNNINASVYIALNPLEGVCKEINYIGNRAVLRGLLANSAIEITSSADSTVLISNKNLINIPNKTLSAEGYLTTGTNHRQPILLTAGIYRFSMNCSGYSSNKNMSIVLKDADGNSIYSDATHAIADNVSFTFEVPEATQAATITIYVNSAGSYSNVMISPQEISDTSFVECSQKSFTFTEQVTRRILQRGGTYVVMPSAGTLTISASQTPIAYADALIT